MEGSVLAHSLRGYSPSLGEGVSAGMQDCLLPSQWSASRGHEHWNSAHIVLLVESETPAHCMGPPIFRVNLLFSAQPLEIPSQTCLESCLLGDSKSS